MSLTIEISSVEDRDELVAEIWWQDSMVAEINRNIDFQIDIFPNKSGAPWSFDFAELMDILLEARRRLN